VERTVARGVAVRRARIISEPVTDYVRFEHAITASNIRAGEEVRWLGRRCASDLSLPGNDFWLIDDRLVRFNIFSGEGEAQDPEHGDDPQERRPQGVQGGGPLRLAQVQASRIENGRVLPSDADIRAWYAACSAEQHIEEGNHRFVLLVEETWLRHRIGAPEVMAGQLTLAQTLYTLPDGAPFHMTSTPPPNDSELLSHHELEVFADCSTPLIQDDDARLGEPEPAWFDTLVDNWINTVPGTVGIGAARPFDDRDESVLVAEHGDAHQGAGDGWLVRPSRLRTRRAAASQRSLRAFASCRRSVFCWIRRCWTRVSAAAHTVTSFADFWQVTSARAVARSAGVGSAVFQRLLPAAA